jgi:hypothetical protein
LSRNGSGQLLTRVGAGEAREVRAQARARLLGDQQDIGGT